MQSDFLKVIGINSKGYGLYPKLVAQDRRLTPEAKAIYAYFCSYAGSGNTAFPTVSKIIYDLVMGKNRYYKHFNLLIKYGYISVEQVIGDKNKFGHNIYTLNLEISPCTCFGDTENGDTQNGDTNNNNLKNNNFNKKIKNKKEKRKPEQESKWEEFYL